LSLILSTPPGTPIISTTDPVPSRVGGVSVTLDEIRQGWLESQDRSGKAALSAYVLSGVSTSLALALSLGLVPFHVGLWNAGSWFLHHFSSWLWALPIVLGFTSARRIPRFLAWFSLGLAVLYYGWHWLPITQSPSTPVKLLYIASAAVIAAPALLRHYWATRRDGP